MNVIESTIEKLFLETTLTSSDGITWKIVENTDTLPCLSMTNILKILFDSIQHKNRHMMFIPLDIWCPPMAPIEPVVEKEVQTSSKWRFCIKCHERIKKYGRLVLFFVTGFSKQKRVMAWEPMLACANCTSKFSNTRHHYFPWIVSIRSLWDNTINAALNVCHGCLCPVNNKIVCSNECSIFMQKLENLKNEKKTEKKAAYNLEALIIERMINAEVSIHEPILCSQCNVVKNCLGKAKGNCKRCGKIAFCALHRSKGESHIEEEECNHFIDIWNNKNFVIL